MTIKRFKDYQGLNEDQILAKCGHPKAYPIVGDGPYYKEDGLVFLLLDEVDVIWQEKPNAFSTKAGVNSRNKSEIARDVYKRPIVVFIKKKCYSFYGIYKMENPFFENGGVNGLVDGDMPFRLNYDSSTCDENYMISF